MSTSTPSARLVITSFPNDGRKLRYFIMALLKSGLVACIQRLNYAKSYYFREGELKREEEKILLIKTIDTNLPAIKQFFAKQHPHKLPEMLIFTPETTPEYLQWLIESPTQRPVKGAKSQNTKPQS